MPSKQSQKQKVIVVVKKGKGKRDVDSEVEESDGESVLDVTEAVSENAKPKSSEPVADKPKQQRRRSAPKSAARQDLLDLIHMCGKRAAKSVKTYADRLGVVRDRFHEWKKVPPPQRGDHRWLGNGAEIAEFVRTEWENNETRKITFEALRCAASVLEGAEFEMATSIFLEEIGGLSQLSRTRYLTQTMSQKELDNWIDWNELFDKVLRYRQREWPKLAAKDEWTEHDFRLAQELLGVCVYVFLPPLRGEWYKVKVRGFDPENDNYIDWRNRQVIMNDYKTSDFYGDNVLDIEDQGLWDMMTYARQRGNGSAFLFQNTLGAPYMDSSNWGQFLQRVFKRLVGKSLGPQMLRKIFITKMTESMPRLEDSMGLKTLARQMGHNPETQQEYRRFADGPLDKRIKQVHDLRTQFPGHTRQPDKATTMPMTEERLKSVSRRMGGCSHISDDKMRR